MVFKSKIRLVALLGLALSFLSLATHLLLVRYSAWKLVGAPSDLQAFMISWPISEDFPRMSPSLEKVWQPIDALNPLRPFALPREPFPGPSEPNNGFLFVRIKGGFHDIRSSICDVVVVARLLNVTLVLPELQEVAIAKGISSKFKEFGYIYDEEHFMSALANDVPIIKDLPKQFKMIKQEKMMTLKFPPSTASTSFYFKEVLPDLKMRGVIGLVISRGGCLQAILPANLAEHQRLRCRVAFEALQFRNEVKELGFRMVQRLQALGQPYLAFHTGLELDTLAYHGCGEHYQDVHTELIRSRRALMIKKRIVKGELNADSELKRRNGSCPLMPEEVGVLLRALGYGPHTRIYISGAEIFGGQRVLVPLRAMFSNLEDRLTLTTEEERAVMFGPEKPLPASPPPHLIMNTERERLQSWAKAGPRPRPLPPPPGRQKFSHEVEGWWGWVGDVSKEPDPTLYDLTERGHRLLWAALDYIVCMEATVFFPGFERDGNGLPSFASLIMGHRLYKSASSKTYRPNRKVIVDLLEGLGEQIYHPNQSRMVSVRHHFKEALGEIGLTALLHNTKSLSFLSHPLPECMCRVVPVTKKTSRKYTVQREAGGLNVFGEDICPGWMQQEDSRSMNKDQVDTNDGYSDGQPEEDLSGIALLPDFPTAKEPAIVELEKRVQEGNTHDADEEVDTDD